MSHFHDFDAVVLDIEGTTTSIRFVYEVLFPHARQHFPAFLQAHQGDAGVQADLVLVHEQACADLAAGLNAPQLPKPDAPDYIAQVTANLLWQMDRDCKTTGLKSLQGRIWKTGYVNGEIKGHVYPDVPPALQRLKDRGCPTYIYSSGSVAAQKLLFGHSEAGDLQPMLSGYFDTTTGPKKEASSYTAIAAAIGCAPDRVVFGTDNPLEAAAAQEAGMQVAVFVRPGNPALPEDHGFVTVSSMDEIV